MDRDLAYDVEIDGLRFMSGTSVQNPYQRALAKVLRAQMDNNQNPDSNSLAGWWIRGQGDWSGGAGREYQEPPTDTLALRQFDSSAGVDPFTEPGFLTLLPKAKQIGQFTGTATVFMANSGEKRFVASGNTVYRIDGETLTALTGFTGTVSGLVIAGSKVLVLTDKGGWMCGIAETAMVQAFTTTKGEIRGGWVKQRLMLAQGPRLYEQTLPTDGKPIDLDQAKILWTHPDETFQWVAVTNSPQAILVAGWGTAGSEVFALTFDSTGKLPTAAAPISIAEFPPNERITDMRSYLGAYLCFATDKGVRVGSISDGSSGSVITYGPLLDSPIPTGRFSMFDRFAIYPAADAGDGQGGLVKVDLSVVDQDGRAAWAAFLRASKGVPARALLALDHRAALVADSDGSKVTVHSFAESNGLEPFGWIQGGWVRFGTLERKNFVDVTVITEPDPKGEIDVLFMDDKGKGHGVGVMDNGTQEATFTITDQPTMSDGAIQLNIMSDEQGLGPKVNSWSLRALPTPKRRSQLVQLILNCYDFERDMHGVTIGYEGRAMARYNALLALVQDGQTVPVNEISASTQYMAMCEELSFTQNSAPAPGSGFGGTVALTMRIVS